MLQRHLSHFYALFFSCLTLTSMIEQASSSDADALGQHSTLQDGKWQSAITAHHSQNRGLQDNNGISSLEGGGTGYRLYEADGCSVTCGEAQFCGKDSQCHDVSCANIYDFGLQEYTHRDLAGESSSSEELQCVDFGTNDRDRTFFWKEDIECQGVNDLPMAASLQCGAVSTCPDSNNNNNADDRPYVPLNRKCTAKTTPERFFSCYEYSPETDLDTYFADYVADTENLQASSPSCPTTDDDESEVPLHTYANRCYYSYYSDGILNRGIYGNGLPSDGRSETFNATLAGMAMIVRSDFLYENRNEEEGFPRCSEDGGCGYDEFCGIDQTCHTRNCEDFYQFAPTQFTGNKTSSTDDSSLSCEVGAIPDDITPPCASYNGTFPTLVHLTCQPTNGIISSGDPLCQGQDSAFAGGDDRTKGRYAVANRVCRASPNPRQEFVCYDMAPGTDLTEYFQDNYVDLIAANPGCDGISEENGGGQSFNDSLWEARYHEVESCFTRPGYGDCTNGFISRNFDATVMMPPAMHTQLSGPFLEQEDDAPDEDSAFCVGPFMMLGLSLFFVPLLTTMHG